MNWLTGFLNMYRGPMTWGDVAITYAIWAVLFLVFWGVVQLGV